VRRRQLGSGKSLARKTFQGYGIHETNENAEMPKKKIGCARILVDGTNRTQLRIRSRSRCPQSSQRLVSGAAVASLPNRLTVDMCAVAASQGSFHKYIATSESTADSAGNLHVADEGIVLAGQSDDPSIISP
jgi:hypothetical protein